MALAALLAISCGKENGPDPDSFKADYEPNVTVTEVTVAAVPTADISGIEADIILQTDGTVTSELQDAERFDIELSSSTETVLRHNGICYLAASLEDGDQALLTDAVTQNGGKWVLYIDGTLSAPGFIDCIYGFMGQEPSYQGQGLYMHTDLFSRIGAFSINGSQEITFTIKGATK